MSLQCTSKLTICRRATPDDAFSLHQLFIKAYSGKYPLGHGEQELRGQIGDTEHYLWMIAVELDVAVAAICLGVDEPMRSAKVWGAVVAPSHRRQNVASDLLQAGMQHLLVERGVVDVLFATTRVVNAGPTRLATSNGFTTTGFLPNAVQIELLESLNFVVYLSPAAHAQRRARPRLCSGVERLYAIAAARLALGPCEPVAVTPMPRAPKWAEALKVVSDAAAIERASSGLNAVGANILIQTEGGASQVFVNYSAVGKAAEIVAIRTDYGDKAALLEGAVACLEGLGAIYVELFASAYEPAEQITALQARFIPSAYFPAMTLAADGSREDRIIFSRTSRMLDLEGIVLNDENQAFVRNYRALYHELYLNLRGTRRSAGA